MPRLPKNKLKKLVDDPWDAATSERERHKIIRHQALQSATFGNIAKCVLVIVNHGKTTFCVKPGPENEYKIALYKSTYPDARVVMQ